MTIDLKYKNIIIAIVKKHVPNCKIYLFGSRSRKKHSFTADIDIALESESILSRQTIGEIQDALEESVLPDFVDVVDLKSVSQDMKKEIERDGIEWIS